MEKGTLIQGTDNYRIPNCPVIIPKENMQMFTAMSQAGQNSPYCTQTFGNQYVNPNSGRTTTNKK